MKLKRPGIASFKKIREAAGLTQKEIADLTGVSQTWVNHFENDSPSYLARTYLAVFYTLMAKEVHMENDLFLEVQTYAQEKNINYTAT